MVCSVLWGTEIENIFQYIIYRKEESSVSVEQ